MPKYTFTAVSFRADLALLMKSKEGVKVHVIALWRL